MNEKKFKLRESKNLGNAFIDNQFNYVPFKERSQAWDNFWQLKSPFKMMKNAFHFHLKALFVLKIFKFLSWLFGHVKKRLDLKDPVNFEIHNVTARLKNNCNTHIAQYLKKKRQLDNEILSVSGI